MPWPVFLLVRAGTPPIPPPAHVPSIGPVGLGSIELLIACDLHTILDCPGGTFLGAGVKTVVLFFDKGAPTRKLWYYQLDPGRNMGKTNPLNDGCWARFEHFCEMEESTALQEIFRGPRVFKK